MQGINLEEMFKSVDDLNPEPYTLYLQTLEPSTPKI